jgi:hypothetical protein
MKTIELTQGKVAIVSDEDYEWYNQWKWSPHSSGYAVRGEKGENGKMKIIYMHREINRTPPGMDTSHLNGNGLDNRRENLRTCTTSENLHNRKIYKNNRSGFKGVSFVKSTGKWRARINVDGIQVNLGNFLSIQEAVSAYNKVAGKYPGEFSKSERANIKCLTGER